MTSDELLEGTDHLYRSIVIIGGGVIGVEFATFYSDLGVQRHPAGGHGPGRLATRIGSWARIWR